jgi:dihydroflavonol-4-reductase
MSNLQKVIVFGASGFLGEHIIKSLISENWDVYAAVRTKPESSTDGFNQTQVTYYEGDLEDQKYIQDAIAGMDAIIFSAGCTWKSDLEISEYYRRNVQITKNFFTALGDRPNVRIVYTSSMSVIAGSKSDYIFFEDSDRSQVSQNQLSPYDLAKIECEQIALDYAQRGNNLVILNPGNMLGPGVFKHSKITTSILVLWFCQKQFPFYINGGHSYCDVRDVAKAHVAALTRGRSGERYIVAGDNLDMAIISSLLVKMTGFKMPQQLPASGVYLLSLLLESLSLFSFRLFKNPYHPDFVKSFSLHYYANSQKATNELGYNITPIETTLIDTIKYFGQRGLLSEELNFFALITPSNIQSLIYLRQLASQHTFSQFALSKISQIYGICQSNLSLNNALDNLLKYSKFNYKAGKFKPDTAKCQEDLKSINQLFEYLYFASNGFLSEVMSERS